jgi:hydroxyacylglutathione hydrolase
MGTERRPSVVQLKMHYRHMTNFNYLVIDPGTKQAVIVDPAWQMERIDQALVDSGAVLSAVLITHSHMDHVHLADALSARYECPIWMSNAEIEYSGFRAERLIGFDPSSAVLDVGGIPILPIATPGHTPGCICYQIGANLFTGDVLFYEGCGMCPDVESAYAMYSSLQDLKARIDAHTLVFPGHSYGMPPGQPFLQVLKDNIYLHFRNKESFAGFRLRKHQRVVNIFGQ